MKVFSIILNGIVILCFLFLAASIILIDRELTSTTTRQAELNSKISNLESAQESYIKEIEELSSDNDALRDDLRASESKSDAIESLLLDVLATIGNDSDNTPAPAPIINTTIILKERRGGSTLGYNIPDDQNVIQNLSEHNDEWHEFCFVQRLTNTTLCYTKTE